MANTIYPALDTQNFFTASPINFTINFARLPELSFVVQEANLPDVVAKTTLQPMPGISIHRVADRLEYQSLSVKFIIDENFRAHRELHDWLVGMTGGADRHKNVNEFIANHENYIWPDYDKRKTYSRTVATSASLIIVNANKYPIAQAVFYNVMPVAISGDRFDIKQDPLKPMTAMATFDYDYYEILEIKL